MNPRPWTCIAPERPGGVAFLILDANGKEIAAVLAGPGAQENTAEILRAVNWPPPGTKDPGPPVEPPEPFIPFGGAWKP